MDKAEKERKLVNMLKDGDKASTLLTFLDAFMEYSNKVAVSELLTTTKDPNIIKADLRASKRVCTYIKNIVGIGKLADNKLKELRQENE